ncbi:MAG: tRNA 2-thiouridine(34) synthase MnmA [Fusobacterium sp.]|uniref:tRNA 2-thiouridine(34) synthase MnmA n=1 Tax=Fusobacterium sp. TaxID=68766 RepID=UPI0026DAD99D|nr:tRNA 2-thiouridine(34) synthase MnmA [Fusobacterium sp.]MDO4690119.1 tRNA 2-thiouridine(34) synthase MnmA [Fusobacterium sp.]
MTNINKNISLEFKKYVKFNPENQNKVIGVAMSGGVDSSTVAYILKEQGYKIFGVTMKTFNDEDSDAKKVCEDLGIEHYVLDVRDDFKEKVMNYFINEYMNGRTPNPCMVCNRHIKFGKLLDFILDKGASYMATGHYTKLKNGALTAGDDGNKDQVYFLAQVKKEKLKNIIFPVGDLEKPKLRELAKELGVRVYSKKDSQEICFVKDGKLKEFLIENSKGTAIKKGNIIDKNGKVLGQHEGFSFYTIGQRKGLRIATDKPLYVLEFDVKTNSIIVGSNEDLNKDELIATNINLFLQTNIESLDNLECFVKTRSRDILHKCILKKSGEDFIVKLIDNTVRAVTPGQGIVFYNNEGSVIAGGFIKK